ncbi:hypothetical protein Syun_008055 [Stephania yunnanensis]|uniref:AAA+ ATPase domain-containing protein n=1 Tax=Stephania yunnanensis TaxID=152371 RepID=A0AAP0L3E9_9MAGN
MDSISCNSTIFINSIDSPLRLFSPVRFATAPRRFRRNRSNVGRFRVVCSEELRNVTQMKNLLIGFGSFRGFGRSRFGGEANSVKLVEDCDGVVEFVRKTVALALFCVVLGFFPARRVQMPAMAVPFVGMFSRGEAERKSELNWKSHEYSGTTKELLKVVSVLLRRIEDVRSSKGGMSEVKEALKRVKLKRKELQEGILNALQGELRELRRQKVELVKRSEEIVDSAWKNKREQEKLLRKDDGGKEELKEQLARLEEGLNVAEKEYDRLWEKVGDIEDQMLRRETMALSIGIRELSFIEQESELLVERFSSEMKHKNMESKTRISTTKLSKSDIQRDLEVAQSEYWEQMVLPKVLEVEGTGIPLDQSTQNFIINIKDALKESKELQRKVEGHIRRKMKRFGEEKHFLLSTPLNEVVKGYPEAELKWVFGNREVVVPKAIRTHLFHGWKQWREEAKAELKKNLLENVDQGKQYVAQIQSARSLMIVVWSISNMSQERILLDRDRVVAKTWHNEGKNRWEMDPLAVPYAVTKKLVENVRIRHDWAAMYVTLKGNEKEYFIDIQELDILFEEFGGFDGLYLKLLGSGIPTNVQLMWIPFSELNIREQFFLLTSISYQCIVGLWNTAVVSYVREWIFQKIKNINDDLMMMIVFPIVDFIIPFRVRMNLGMAWPEEADQTVGATWYLKWQSEAEMNFKSRQTDDFQWFLWFSVRSIIYGYLLFNIFRFMKRKVPSLLGYGPLRKDPNLRKLRRVKSFFNLKLRKTLRRRKEGADPIASAFDQMKRVKTPPIQLKEFASVESMREEINEVVTFLQNPSAFREMGARAPKGVLIVGERGTGKTSLALAIAAEAKVPLVEVRAQQLEAGLWVGQSASNVRELFQTARDLFEWNILIISNEAILFDRKNEAFCHIELYCFEDLTLHYVFRCGAHTAPVIIFVEDFDLFAGVRGKYIHTKKQDHEAFINQLLVELDGFEKQDGVVLMATTRNLKQIDEALRRPGRMDRVFHLQPPTQMEREKILQISAKETMDDELIDFVDWKKVVSYLLDDASEYLIVAEKTALLRPSELKLVPLALEGSAFRSKFLDTDELMSYCGWFATFSATIPRWLRRTKIAKKISKLLVNHLGLSLRREDLQNVVDLMEPYGQISNGIEFLSPPIDWTREAKFPHAVWAAGRALTALLLPNFDDVDNIWLEPLAWEGIGCTKITKAKNEGSMNGNVETRSYLEKKLVFCFGSYIAAQLLLPFGEENLLSSSEIKQAQEIATRMVIQYGWAPDDSPTVYFCNNAVTAMSMGDNFEYEMAAKVERLYNLAYDKAKEMLQKNHRVLEETVEQLLEFEILTGKDLHRILEENGGIREKEPFFLSTINNEENHRDELLRETPYMEGISKEEGKGALEMLTNL